MIIINYFLGGCSLLIASKIFLFVVLIKLICPVVVAELTRICLEIGKPCRFLVGFVPF